jgi:antitoxin CptB
LLELDLLFQRFWQRHGDSLDPQDEPVLARLLEMEDHDLWAVLNGTGRVNDHELMAMADRIRAA